MEGLVFNAPCSHSHATGGQFDISVDKIGDSYRGHFIYIRARLVDYLFPMSRPTLFLGPTLKKNIFLLSDRPCPEELFFLLRTAF